MGRQYKRKDHFYEKAKDSGYRSRASYKLIELNKQSKLLKPGARVLDLGCFPGGWLQVALDKVGPKGLVVGVDLKPVDALERNGAAAKIFQGDIMSPEVQNILRAESPEGYDAVISDLSPKLSGIAFRDAAQSAELVQMGLHIAREFLVEGGDFVAKIFPGQECEELIPQIRSSFRKCSRKNLDSTRKSSKELYILAQGFKGA